MDASWLDRNRSVIFIILLLVALGGGTFFYLRQPAQNPIEFIPAEAPPTPLPSPSPPPTVTPTPAPVRVFITGAVVKSDVYFLPHGSIIKDAIEAAGGFTPDAEPEQINQALELQDQQQIHVPRLDEEDPPPSVQGGQDKSNKEEQDSGSDMPAGGQVINLNTATLDQLDSLPGIGPVIAQRIIDYRESERGFTTIEEIIQVSGIGEATFAKIEDLITVE
jgi:competence protein ComEA